MSDYQKQKTRVECPKCKNTREVCVGHAQKIAAKGTYCQACGSTGQKMSVEARKKMSDSKKKLVAEGWLPTYTKKYKGGHSALPKACPFCSKEFYTNSSKSIFCSKQCSNRSRVADGTHHLWKGGVTSVNSLVRAMTEYKKWKQEVIEQCGFVCGECRASSFPGHFVLMHVDHIVPLSYLIKKHEVTTSEQARNCSKLWEVENGRVLCEECHALTPTFLRKASSYQPELTH